MHNSHVSNMEKVLLDECLIVPIDDVEVNDRLEFVEEPFAILDQ